MDYSIKAIPTRYAGVEFRSRLEARWAAFFDLAAWEWEYEPFDLDGWAPDFRVTLPDGAVFLVEVKPVDFCDRAVFAKALRHGLPDARLISKDAHGEQWESFEPAYRIMCLGTAPFIRVQKGARDFDTEAHYLTCYDPQERRPVSGLGDNRFYKFYASLAPQESLAVAVDNAEWFQTFGDTYSSVEWKEYCRRASADTSRIEVNRRWREAGNRVQWKPRG